MIIIKREQFQSPSVIMGSTLEPSYIARLFIHTCARGVPVYSFFVFALDVFFFFFSASIFAVGSDHFHFINIASSCVEVMCCFYFPLLDLRIARCLGF